MQLHQSAVEPTVPVGIESAGNTFLASALTQGFLPAFQHRLNGEVRLCLHDDGQLAAMHLLDRLPAGWIAQRDRQGRPTALIAEVRAGYLRGSEFWSLGDLRHPRLDS